MADVLTSLTLIEAADAVRSRSTTAAELVAACLDRIAHTEGRIGAFASIQAEQARADARALDQQPATGLLHGIPIALKDLIFSRGVATEGNCRALKGFVPDDDATVVRRLREAGAIIIGKTNTHELAFGVSCPASRNPWAFNRMTGGSSGGNAAALASRQVFGALGTDTGGSVRIPSSYCGTTGLKPTRGVVPRDGTHMLSWTYDTVGPMARTAADCGVLLDVIAGPTTSDPYSVATPLDPAQPVETIRLGIPGEVLLEELGVDAEVRAVLESAIDELRGLVASTSVVSLPDAEAHAAAGGVIVSVEAAALTEQLRADRGQLIGSEISALLATGAAETGTAFARHRAVRQRFEHAYNSIFDDQQVDVVVLPVTPNQVLPYGATMIDGVPLIPATTGFTFPVNGAGLPSIAVPGGLASDGVPIGVQLVGRRFSDRTLVALGDAFQQVTEYHQLAPG